MRASESRGTKKLDIISGYMGSHLAFPIHSFERSHITHISRRTPTLDRKLESVPEYIPMLYVTRRER